MKPVVFIKETQDRRAFTRAVMGRFEDQWAGKKVFVKPNIVSHEPYPTTTHPDVLREVLRALSRHDCEAIVGDGPASGAGSSIQIIENHPLQKPCGEFDVELCNLHDEPFKKVMTRTGYKLRVSTVPFTYEYMISLPVIKYHRRVRMTGALKNLCGFLQNRERILMHTGMRSIHRGIAELHNAFKANLTIMDGIKTLRYGQERRHGGRPVHLGYMLAGQDPVSLDCAGLELLRKTLPELGHIQARDIRYIREAARLGIGRPDFRKAAI